jgi:UbiD family decarboxylase
MDEALRDLRGWLSGVDDLGELRVVEGAHWKHELGGIADLMREQPRVPAVLFDSIADHQRGYRVLSNPFHSLKRVALAIGMPIDLTQAECAARWRKQRKQLKPLPLRTVTGGPILENVLRSEDVDLLRFPAPVWRGLDGGRYIGTACTVMSRDP